MPLSALAATDVLADLDRFDTVIDARSESEYAQDHLPGAVNWPTLTDSQRAQVGTKYKQVSAFDAKKHGAAMAARNIADHLDRELADKGRDWQPLIYCWRGGKRSGSLALVLDQIGFKVSLLEGGYREFRRAVVDALDELPRSFDYRVVCGTTGSGKSRLLPLLAARGAQVLDLEQLANHRGSVLGLVPGSPQPSQKAFDTRVWNALRRFDATQPVWIESESKKVGDVRVPQALIERMRASPCLRLGLSIEARVGLLMQDYAFFVTDVEAFCERLDALRVLRGNEVVDGWQEAARAGRTAEVVRDLLERHYDPVYLQSIVRNFPGYAKPLLEVQWDGSDDQLRSVARTMLERELHVPPTTT
ncbi:MAG: tRNA 2-selenouridine(34) synthase MnmH [Burkholderiaceae bacterium]